MESAQALTSKSMLRRAADALVVVLHPCFLFMYLYMAFTFSVRQGIPDYFLLTGTVLAGTVLLPTLITLVYAGGDMFLGERNTRFVPLLLSAMLYTIVLYALCQIYTAGYVLMTEMGHGEFDMYPEYSVSELAAASMVLINLIKLLMMMTAGMWLAAFVSQFYKISLHALGAGFLCTAVLFPFFFMLIRDGRFSSSSFFTSIILVSLSALMIWQRRVSGAHTKMELVWGLAAGAVGAGFISAIPRETVMSVAFRIAQIF